MRYLINYFKKYDKEKEGWGAGALAQ